MYDYGSLLFLLQFKEKRSRVQDYKTLYIYQGKFRIQNVMQDLQSKDFSRLCILGAILYCTAYYGERCTVH